MRTVHKTRRLAVAAAVGAWLGIAVPLPAAPPASATHIVPQGVVNYQGNLKGPTGANYVDGLYDIEFRLYTVSSGGTPIWGSAYKVYVKDGYFGVMLGQTGTVLSGATYPPTELWRALWFDEASPKNDFWLGLKVLQDENHVTLSPAPAESVPRQQLLVAPFAYRAEQTQYARAAYGDFDVGQILRVTGSTTLSGAATLNGGATLSSVVINGTAELKGTTTLSGATTFSGTATFSQPATFNNTATHNNTTTFTQPAVFNSSVTLGGATKSANGGGLHLQNDDDSANIWLNDAQSFTVNGYGGNTKMYTPNDEDLYLQVTKSSVPASVKLDSGNVNATAANNVAVAATAGRVDVTAGTHVALTATRDLNLAASGGTRGGYSIWINTAHIKMSDSVDYPMFLKSYTAAGGPDTIGVNTLVSTNVYHAMVVGFDSGSGDIAESGTKVLYKVMCFPHPVMKTWYILLDAPCHNDFPDWTVHVLFIHKAFCRDGRTNWGL